MADEETRSLVNDHRRVPVDQTAERLAFLRKSGVSITAFDESDWRDTLHRIDREAEITHAVSKSQAKEKKEDSEKYKVLLYLDITLTDHLSARHGSKWWDGLK